MIVQGFRPRRRSARTDLSALTPEDLFDLDQDHYGGLAAVEALHSGAGGLSGVAMYVIHRLNICEEPSSTWTKGWQERWRP